MDYLYFELDTTGRSPLNSRIANLYALKVTDGNLNTMHRCVENLEDEYLCLKAFVDFSEGVPALAFPEDTVLSYLRECFREYSLPFSLDSRTRLSLKLDDIPVFDIPEYTGELKYFYEDYYNYWYFPLEDKAYHRDIAIYTDPSVRKKATRDTACIKTAGTFVPAPPSCGKKLFRSYPDSRECYILKKDFDLKDYSPLFLVHLLLHISQDVS